MAPSSTRSRRVGVGGILLLALAHAPTLVVLGGAWRALARDTPGASLWTFVWGRMMRDAGGELLPGWAR